MKAEKPVHGLGFGRWYQMSSLLNVMQLCSLVLDAFASYHFFF